jgi:outer membrane protein assembly factor BamB
LHRRPPLAASLLALSLADIAVLSISVRGADAPQWGQAWTRNQVSAETGLADSFDPATGRNVRWTAPLGTEAHSTPVVAGGRVYIGTNNNRPRDPQHRGDRGVLFCLDEKDGRLLWQLVVPKRSEDPYFDWPNSGISSPATVEGERVYIVSNRGEVLCLDARGLANGNDGPFRDEGRHMTPAGDPALEPGSLDADILWLFDLTSGAGIWSHDAAHSSILIRGGHLYLNTGTGVDNTHRKIRTPDAPSLVVLDKATGRLLARDREGIAPAIFHSTWSPPSLAAAGGQELVVFAAGNGVVYGFRPLAREPPPGEVLGLEKVWWFDFDPAAPKEDVHAYHQNRKVGPSNIYGFPVVHEGRVYVAGGGDFWWGKLEARIQCFDAAGAGDITRSGKVWSADLERHVFSTPAVHGGLVYIADTRKRIYCLDARDGSRVWTHDARGEFWASPYVADGKVFIGSRQGEFLILAAGREKRVLAEVDLEDPISATAVAANGVLYAATMSRLFAIAPAATPGAKRQEP